MEIEFEGPNFLQEYKAALEHLHIVDGAQTTLGDTDFEVSPKHEAKHHKAPASPSEPSGALSYVEMAKEEREKEEREEEREKAEPVYDLENPGPTPTQEGQVNPAEDLLFRALARATKHPEPESAPPPAEQSSEQKEGSKPMFDDKKTPETEGAVPTDKYPNDRFKEILKRMGLATGD